MHRGVRFCEIRFGEQTPKKRVSRGKTLKKPKEFSKKEAGQENGANGTEIDTEPTLFDVNFLDTDQSGQIQVSNKIEELDADSSHLGQNSPK